MLYGAKNLENIFSYILIIIAPAAVSVLVLAKAHC